MDIESLLFDNSGQPAADINPGDLLISNPLMEEPIFKRSVILMLDADIEKGSMGLVLNHRLSLSLRDLIPGWENGSKVPLYAGGPVDLERLFLIHRLGNVFPESKRLFGDIFVGAEIDNIIDYVDAGNPVDGYLRFFLGYSGWDANQLQSEMLKRYWTVSPAVNNSEIFMGTGNEFWRREVGKLGDDFRSWLLVPSEPNLN